MLLIKRSDILRRKSSCAFFLRAEPAFKKRIGLVGRQIEISYSGILIDLSADATVWMLE